VSDQVGYSPTSLRNAMHHRAVKSTDKWLVVRGDQVVEGWPGPNGAARGASILNDHAVRWGGSACYRVVEADPNLMKRAWRGEIG